MLKNIVIGIILVFVISVVGLVAWQEVDPVSYKKFQEELETEQARLEEKRVQLEKEQEEIRIQRE